MALLSMIGSTFSQDPSCHFNHLNIIIKTICGCFRIWHTLFIARVANAKPGRRFAALCLPLSGYAVGKNIIMGLSFCFYTIFKHEIYPAISESRYRLRIKHRIWIINTLNDIGYNGFLERTSSGKTGHGNI